MDLAAWAERNGVARVTAYRWFRAGQLAVGKFVVALSHVVGELSLEVGEVPDSSWPTGTHEHRKL